MDTRNAKEKLFASTLTYLSTAHSHSIIDKYDELEPIFKVLGECEDGNKIENFYKQKFMKKDLKD